MGANEQLYNEQLYKEASAAYGSAMRRVATGYEADPDRRRDLLQEIHIELWRSPRLFDGRCSLRTWVDRVAHNVAASHVSRRRHATASLVDLDALESEPGFLDGESQAHQRYWVSRVLDSTTC